MEKPDKTVDELLESLKGRVSPDIEAELVKRLSTKRENFIELPEVGSLDAIVARLDKLQETVDGIAAKLDSEGPA